MILGFKQQFKPKILADTKKHTIREDKSNQWKAGNIIHFATGVRTKFYECFKIGKCVSVQIIEIIYLNKCSDYPKIIIDSIAYCAFENKDFLQALAKNDGFYSFDDFCKWFDKDFKGKIIHWTALRY